MSDTPSQTTAPERIWLNIIEDGEPLQLYTGSVHGVTEYVRADLYDRLQALLADVLSAPFAEECQECAIGQSEAWTRAKESMRHDR